MAGTTTKRGSLNPSAFIEGALAVTKTHGLGQVSLRTIAGEMGISHMALYKHYPNKDALVEAMIDHVMGLIVPPPLVPAQWQAWVETVGLEIVSVLDRHPGLADAVLNRIPNRLTPHGVDLADAFVTALQSPGLDRRTAGTAFLVIFTYIVGAVSIRSRHESAIDDDRLPESVHDPLDDTNFLIGLRLIVYGIAARAPHHADAGSSRENR